MAAHPVAQQAGGTGPAHRRPVTQEAGGHTRVAGQVQTDVPAPDTVTRVAGRAFATVEACRNVAPIEKNCISMFSELIYSFVVYIICHIKSADQ